MHREPNKKSDNDSPELASCNAVRQKQDTFRTVMMCQGFLAMPIFLWFSMGDFEDDSNDSTTPIKRLDSTGRTMVAIYMKSSTPLPGAIPPATAWTFPRWFASNATWQQSAAALISRWG